MCDIKQGARARTLKCCLLAGGKNSRGARDQVNKGRTRELRDWLLGVNECACCGRVDGSQPTAQRKLGARALWRRTHFHRSIRPVAVVAIDLCLTFSAKLLLLWQPAARVRSVMISRAVAVGAARITVQRRPTLASDEPPGAAALIAEIALLPSWMCEAPQNLTPAGEPQSTAGSVVAGRATGRADASGGKRQCYDAEKGNSRNITR